MMYKATVTFSLLFLAVQVVGSPHLRKDGGADTSSQPPSNFSSPTAYPSGGIPTNISTTPTDASDGDSSQTNRTRPSGCYRDRHNSTTGIPTDQPLSSGVFSSAAHGASHVSKPHFSCEPDSEESTTIPTTGRANVSHYSGAGALPSTNVSRPAYTRMAPTGAPTGSHHGHHHNSNFTLPTGSSKPFPSGTGQQNPPDATATSTSYGKLDCL
jgi:hypothetical protein